MAQTQPVMYGQQPYGQQMYEYEQQPQEMYTAYTYNNGQQAPYNNGQQAAMGRQAQQISSYNTLRLGYQKKVLEEWRNPDVRQVEKWTKEMVGIWLEYNG